MFFKILKKDMKRKKPLDFDSAMAMQSAPREKGLFY